MVLDIVKLISSFEEICREKGLRLTPQRLEIYTELAWSSDHPTAEALHQRLLVKLPMLSLDTVYRALTTFVELGVANRVETCERQGHFEMVSGPHHHLICRECGQISDFDWELIASTPLPSDVVSWGLVERKTIVLHGVCRECLDS